MSRSPLSLIVEVRRRRQEARDIVSFELVDPHGRPLPAFDAGAHIDVRVSPQGQDDVIRQYSLCNPPGERDRYLIGVLRDARSRGGSRAMHDEIREGDLLQIGAPRNHFPLHPAGRSLLLAGGIGITPLLCMAERLSREGADFQLHYCTRSAERAAFRERIAASGFAERVHFHFDDGDEAQRFDLAALAAAPDPDARVYVCGPGGFIDAVLTACRAGGWRPDRLHTEYFAGARLDADDDRSFEVELASSGARFTIPGDKSVHQVLAENGIEILVSCEQGVCGTCLTRVLEGEPDHRDLYLDDAERAANDRFTPCCSRARSKRLVLDL